MEAFQAYTPRWTRLDRHQPQHALGHGFGLTGSRTGDYSVGAPQRRLNDCDLLRRGLKFSERARDVCRANHHHTPVRQSAIGGVSATYHQKAGGFR